MSPIIKTLTADLYWSRNVGAALFAAARNSKCDTFFSFPFSFSMSKHRFMKRLSVLLLLLAVGSGVYAQQCCDGGRELTACTKDDCAINDSSKSTFDCCLVNGVPMIMS